MSRRFLACALLVVTAGCAHSSVQKDSVNDRGSIYIEPKMSPQSVPLRLRSRSSTRFHGEVQVPVDATGRPDVLGIRVIGTMDSLMKQDLQEWLSTTSFVPAKRDGVPVAGVFKMKFN